MALAVELRRSPRHHGTGQRVGFRPVGRRTSFLFGWLGNRPPVGADVLRPGAVSNASSPTGDDPKGLTATVDAVVASQGHTSILGAVAKMRIITEGDMAQRQPQLAAIADVLEELEGLLPARHRAHTLCRDARRMLSIFEGDLAVASSLLHNGSTQSTQRKYREHLADVARLTKRAA